MPRVCHFTGRKTTFGKQITHRGKAKYLGGVGTKVTGITARKFKPNIQTVRVLTPDGTVMRVKLSTRAIKSGVMVVEKGGKTVKFPLVRALRGRNRAFTKAQRAEG